MHSLSKIVRFYAGEETDDRGRTLNDLLSWDDERLEYIHDYIQWLFPLNEGSMFNASAPILMPADIDAFRDNPALQDNLRRSFQRILAFYGYVLEDTNAAPVIAPSAEFSVSAENWLTPGNHNFLRLTRIIKCLMLLGLEAHARALFEELEKLFSGEARQTIGPRTMQFWRDAVDIGRR